MKRHHVQNVAVVGCGIISTSGVTAFGNGVKLPLGLDGDGRLTPVYASITVAEAANYAQHLGDVKAHDAFVAGVVAAVQRDQNVFRWVWRGSLCAGGRGGGWRAEHLDLASPCGACACAAMGGNLSALRARCRATASSCAARVPECGAWWAGGGGLEGGGPSVCAHSCPPRVLS
jgi:hypothetical protein